jgi:hypothetical protein
MRDLIPQASVHTIPPQSHGRAFPLVGRALRNLRAGLRRAGRCRRGGGAFHAGYALRDRQTANRQRLACPACRPGTASRRCR